MGNVVPDSGSVYIDGKDLKTFDNEEINYYRSKYLSILNQDNTLLLDLNLKDNLKLVLSISNKEYDEKNIKNLLNSFKLNEDILNQMPDEISGGELKRFQLILALVKDTKVILLDEPDSSLDIENQKIIKELVKEISNDKLVVVVSHNVKLYEDIESITYEIKNKTIESCNFDTCENTFCKEKMKRIPLKFLVLLGLKYTKTQIFKLVSSFIVFTISLLLFAISLSFLTYDFEANYNSEIIYVERDFYNNNLHNTLKDRMPYMDDNINYLPMYESEYFVAGKSNYVRLKDSLRSDYISKINENDIDVFNLNIKGNVPKKNQIAVSSKITNDDSIVGKKYTLEFYGGGTTTYSIEVEVSAIVESEHSVIFLNESDLKQYNSMFNFEIKKGYFYSESFYSLEKMFDISDAKNAPGFRRILGTYFMLKQYSIPLYVLTTILFLVSLFVVIDYSFNIQKNKLLEMKKIYLLGGTKKSVFIIFAFPLFVLLFGSSIFALFLHLIIEKPINKLLYDIMLNEIVHINFNTVLSFLVICIITFILSTYIPSIKIRRRK